MGSTPPTLKRVSAADREAWKSQANSNNNINNNNNNNNNSNNTPSPGVSCCFPDMASHLEGTLFVQR